MGGIDCSLIYDTDDDDDDDGDDDVGEWVVLTVPLSRQLQFLMQAGRCQVLMLLFDDDGDDDDDDDHDDDHDDGDDHNDHDDHDDHDDEKGS